MKRVWNDWRDAWQAWNQDDPFGAVLMLLCGVYLLLLVGYSLFTP